MDLLKDVTGALHLPGLNVWETIGAGFALSLGHRICSLVLRFAARIPGMLQGATRSAPAPSGRRGR